MHQLNAIQRGPHIVPIWSVEMDKNGHGKSIRIPKQNHRLLDVWGFLLGVDLFFRGSLPGMSSRSRSERKRSLWPWALTLIPWCPIFWENEMSHLKWYRRTRDSWQSAILETRCIFEALSRSCGTSSFCLSKAPAVVFRRPWKIWVCLKMSCTPTPNGFADHYPYFLWLFHRGYSPFSDIPIAP